MAREKNTDQRREQIVDALQAVMSREGYEKATVAAVAREAGLAPGLVHYHFASKQEILVCLVEHLSTKVQLRFDELAVKSAGTGLDVALRALVERGPGADARAVACWTVIAAEAIRQPAVREVFERAVRAQVDHLAHLIGQQAPSLDRGSVRARAVALMATVQGYYQLAIAIPGLVPPGSAARQMSLMSRAMTRTNEED